MTATYQADAVVIGAGLAGLVTALELLDAGRSVVLLDRAGEDRIGGLARISFGGIFVVGTPEQRRAGFRDDPELALADWVDAGELGEPDVWPRRWAEAYVAGSRERVYDWLRGHGVGFFPVVHWVERGGVRRGNSVPRFHLVWGTGERLVDVLLAAIETHRCRGRLLILHRHRVTDLVREGDRFTGCTGTVSPRDIAGSSINEGGKVFRALGDAVVVASGGIMGNLDLVRKHWPAAWGDAPAELLNGAHPDADGELHAVAATHGARVTHLDRMWLYAAGVRHWAPTHAAHGLSLIPPRSALWLDARGRRIGPVPLVTGHDTRHLVETIARQSPPWSWQVFNERIARRELAVSGSEFNPAIRNRRALRFVLEVLAGNRRLVAELIANCPDFVVADSVPELAQAMSRSEAAVEIDPALLGDVIRAFDGEMARGRASTDSQVQAIAAARAYRGDRARTCRFARIDDPRARPLIAVRERLVTRKSLGGIQTDLHARVLDGRGEPMTGLYAVGEAAGFGGGGIHGVRSLEGTFLGGCVFGGRQAAASIVDS